MFFLFLLRRATHPFNSGPLSFTSKNGTSSPFNCEVYWNGKNSAYSSTKKSNGLITSRRAITSTSTTNMLVRSGKTTLAWKFPNGSCCQLMK